MPIHTSPIVLAQALDVTSDVQKVALGTTVFDTAGNKYEYCQAASEFSAYAAGTIKKDGTAILMTTTTVAASGKKLGTPQVSVASGYYAWFQTAGKMLVNLAANCAPAVPLYTTATGGVLDDAEVTAGLVYGAVADNTISNATAVTVLMNQGAGIFSGNAD